MNNSNSFLEEEKIGKLMRKFSIPCIISLLVGALYNIVDQLFISNASYLGSFGNAASTVVFPLTVIVLAIATMIGDGACSFISKSLGEKNSEKAGQAAANAIILFVIIGFVIMAIYLIFNETLINLFGGKVNDETFNFSKEYFFWIALGVVFYMFGQGMNPIIRADGSPRFAMISMLAGAITNLILDPIFIFLFKWGMTGAAIATVIGQIVTAVLSLLYLFKTKAIKFNKTCFVLDFNLIKRIFTLGLSSFLTQIAFVLSLFAVLNMCKKYAKLDEVFCKDEYSHIPTACIGIVMKFFQIVMSIAIGLSAGLIPVVSYNEGAKRYDRLKEILRKLLILELIIGFICTCFFELSANLLTNIFGGRNESVVYREFMVKAIRVFLISLPLACFNKGVLIYLQALGKGITSTLLALLREIVLGTILVFILPLVMKLNGVIYFEVVADVITFIVTLFVLRNTRKTIDQSAKVNNHLIHDIDI